MTVLDWSGRDGVQHQGGGMLRSCRTCGHPALLVDGEGRPQHKTCAEREALLALPAAGPPCERIPDDITLPSLEAEALG